VKEGRGRKWGVGGKGEGEHLSAVCDCGDESGEGEEGVGRAGRTDGKGWRKGVKRWEGGMYEKGREEGGKDLGGKEVEE